MKRTLCPVAATLAACSLISSAAAQPVNDTCANAIPVANHSVTAWDPTGATRDVLLPCNEYNDIAMDVWFSYTAGGAEQVTITTCGGGAASALAVFDGCGGALLACNALTCGPEQLESEVVFQAPGAGTYLICVVGFDGLEGPALLGVNAPVTAPPPANDSCQNAQLIEGPGTVAYNNRAATDGLSGWCNPGDSRDVYYRYVAGSEGFITVDTLRFPASGTLDTTLQILSGCGGAVLACNDNHDVIGWDAFRQSRICYFPVVAGTEYLIRLATVGAAGGAGFLALSHVSPPPAYAVPPGAIAEPGNACDADATTDVNFGCSNGAWTYSAIEPCGTYRGHAAMRSGNWIGDNDTYRFTLAAEDTVTVTGQSRFTARFYLSADTCNPFVIYGDTTQTAVPACGGGVGEFGFTRTLAAGSYTLVLGNIGNTEPCGENDEYWFTIAAENACRPACPANFDRSADGVQVADIFAYLSAWFGADPAADFDGSGGPPAVGDIFAFLGAWFAGCP